MMYRYWLFFLVLLMSVMVFDSVLLLVFVMFWECVLEKKWFRVDLIVVFRVLL